MVVFGTDMHIVTFLIILLEMVFFFYQIVYYLSRPTDKNRLYYLILLYLLIQQNITGGLLPDKNIPINITLQYIIAFIACIVMAMYFPYYFFKSFKLDRLKFYAYWGSVVFIFIPFILCFVIPYYITNDIVLSRRMVVVVPFFYALSFLYSLNRAIQEKNNAKADKTSKQEIIGMYIAVTFWCTLPIIAFFEYNINDILQPYINFHNGSQLVEVLVTNAGLFVVTILFIRQTVQQSRSEYNKLLDSERELQELNMGLTIKVRERTRELELANEQRTNTFINLAHETKTPLTLINNYLEEYINKHGQTEELKIIKYNIEKLTRDIVNFFDMERIQKGLNIYDDTQITDFSKMLSNNMVLFKQYANKKDIKIIESIENQLFVKADPESLNRIINNLIENAIKYTDVNGMIAVSLICINEKICFSVKDNGIGIPVHLHSKIFEPYYQINSEKKNFQGMGMGLSIVKKIIESLNGEITLISDPKEKTGTEIIVQLPVHRILNGELISGLNTDIHASYPMPEPLNVEQMAYDENKPTIMVVEDNIPLANFMITKLKEKYNLNIALSGKEALEQLKTIKQLDLIVSDVMMDNGDGFEFYDGISKQKRLSHIPFIFLTAKTNIDEKIKGLSLGAIDYIFKPFHISELINKIDSVLNNLSEQREALIHHAYKALLNNDNGQIFNNSNQNQFESICNRYNLTTREKEVVKLIAIGKTYKEIANTLHISDKTVAKHIQNMFEKTNVTNKVELVNKLGASVMVS